MQRKTQTNQFWQQQFKLSSKDIEAIYQQIFEQNSPVHIDNIALNLVTRLVNEEEVQTRRELQDGRLYQPSASCPVGDKLIFPALDFATGKVISTRTGQHPDYGSFTVVTVDFGGDRLRDFVADFQAEHRPHRRTGQRFSAGEGVHTPEELYALYGSSIRSKIQTALDESPDFAKFHDQYLLVDLLPEFNEGLYNIADAAIDINQGPLSVNALIEQMGTPQHKINDVLRFSVNYRLDSDERFEDVGPSGEVSWYLERMAPPEAYYPPRRLQNRNPEYDPSIFNDDLLDLLSEIDDELTHPDDVEVSEEGPKRATIVLNYPHWRVGTLPLTPKSLPFFPKSNYNPVRFEFVDGRTGEKFPGWTVYAHKYVFGLDRWYSKNKLPVGAFITVRPGKEPLQVIVEFDPSRSRDWVRLVSVSGNKLTFTMNPSPVGCTYDELMIIGDHTPDNTDKAWLGAEERDLSVYDILCNVFPELSKLNPQSTVHAKTLYSAVNLLRRTPPGIVFQELVKHPAFIHIDHGYWTYDPSLRD